MGITWLGILLIPVGIILFLVAPKSLPVITVFSVPFTATSLFNSSSGVPLSPLQFFGLLFIVRQALSSRRRPVKPLRGDHSQLLLVLFLGVVLLSMTMPLIINGRLVISSNQLNDLYDEPLRLNVHNIKNPLPVIFGVILSLCLIAKSNTTEEIRSVTKVYVLSGVFASLWGYFQFLCNSVFHIEYPAFLFNNAVTESMKGYGWQIEVGAELYSRISSVTHEASIFSKYLLTVIPIVAASVWLRKPLFSARRDKWILSIMVGSLILTTSATAYLGIVCVSVVTAFVLRSPRLIGWRWITYAGPAGLIFITLYNKVPVFQDIVDAMIFMKYESGSALERTLSIMNAWEYFKQYPILGVGWAFVTSHSLLTFLLVSTGILGFAAFFALIFYVLHRSFQGLTRLSTNGELAGSDEAMLLVGFVVALVTAIVIGILTGLEFYLGYFYFVLSMLIATNIVTRSRLDGTKLDTTLNMMRNVEVS